MIDYVSRVWVNGHYPPETWNMHQHHGVTTNNNSEACLGNKKRISKHPNVYLFVSVIIEELKTSLSDAVRAKTGNINKKSWSTRTKRERAAKMKQTLINKLEENNIELICYQQAMGGATVRSPAVRDVDFSETEKLNLAGDEEDIHVPALHEIMVPLSVSSLRRSDPEVQGECNPGPEEEIIQSQSHVQAQYRHVSVSQKRKSDLSYSVGGDQLRKRRRRQHDVEVPTSAVVHLSYDNYHVAFEGEISKEEYFKFHNKPWPQTLSGRLSLEQGKFVMEQRFKELDFSQSGDTPGDGNCMMLCLVDQMSYSEGLRDFAESAKDLRWKICNYGYDFYLRTGRLTWSFDPEIGSPAEWKRKMSQDGCWGDEIFLVLASNILQVDGYFHTMDPIVYTDFFKD